MRSGIGEGAAVQLCGIARILRASASIFYSVQNSSTYKAELCIVTLVRSYIDLTVRRAVYGAAAGGAAALLLFSESRVFALDDLKAQAEV